MSPREHRELRVHEPAREHAAGPERPRVRADADGRAGRRRGRGTAAEDLADRGGQRVERVGDRVEDRFRLHAS